MALYICILAVQHCSVGWQVQSSLLAEAEAFRDANIVDVTSYEELKQAVADGKWARGPWAGQAFSQIRRQATRLVTHTGHASGRYEAVVCCVRPCQAGVATSCSIASSALGCMCVGAALLPPLLWCSQG